jgi:hypothetical protein
MLAYIFGHRCNPFALLAVCAVTALMCRYANVRKPLRFAPLVLLLGCGFIARSAADYIVAMFASGYVVITVAAGNFTVERNFFLKRFKRLVIAWGFILFTGLGFDWSGYAPFSDAVAFAVIFFVAGIALLRATLHFEETLKRASFKLLNFGTVLLVAAAGLALGSEVVTGNIFAVLYFLYRHTLYYLLYGAVWLVTKPFNLSTEPLPVRPQPTFTPDYVSESIPVPAYDVDSFWNTIRLIVIPPVLVMFSFLLIYLIYKFIRWMLDKGYNKPMPYSEGQRDAASIAAKPRADTGARASVRRYYRRFLKLCRQSDIRVTPMMASEDVSYKAVAVFGATDKLREVYIMARYGSEEITGSDVSEARGEYLRLKKNKG